MDRIEGVTVTDKSFTPRYAVELSESGPIAAPPISRNPEIYHGTKPKKPVSRSLGISRSTSGFGPKYEFECPICGKRFTHKSYDGSLNPHKDKHGYPCGGRLGMYIGMK